MAEEKKIATGYIGNALRSAADNHTTTFADEIFDTERQKYQNEVNADLETKIAEEKAAIMDTDRIADGAITTEKVADGAVVTEKIVDSAVTYDKLQPEMKEIVENIYYVENPEFLSVKTDAEGRLLWWIEKDGTVNWSKGVPQPIQVKLQELEQKIKDNADDNKTLAERVTANEAAIVAINKALENYKVEVAEALSKKMDGEYIENPEFVHVYTDSEGKVLEGIKVDGTKVIEGDFKVFGSMELLGVLYKVVKSPEYLAAWVDAEDKVIFGLKTDGKTYVGDADFLNDIKNNQEAISEINATIASINSTIEHLDIDTLTLITATENPEFIEVELDSDDKILSGRKVDGTKFENNDVELNGNATVGGSLEIDGVAIKNIEDLEERLSIELDADDKILSYRDKDGVKHEEMLKVNHLTLTNEGMNEFQQALKDAGFRPGSGWDWSDKKVVEVPHPTRYAILNFHIGQLPKYDGEVKKGYAEYYDGIGNYFKKAVKVETQGQSSKMFAKTDNRCNYTLDIDDGSEIKFGYWVPQDSFHLKGTPKDITHGILATSYKWAYMFMEYLDAKPNRVLLEDSSKITTTGASGDRFTDWIDDARCLPDGFPVEIYVEDEYWGLYALQLKKHRKNYSIKKSDYTSLFIDADNLLDSDYQHGFWLDGVDSAPAGTTGKTWWNYFDIKGPKDLICMDGSPFDGDNPKELIDSTSPVYDSSDKKHKGSAQTKAIIRGFSTKYLEVKTLIDNNNIEGAKAKFNENFDYNACMLVYIFNCLMKNGDSIKKNTLWGTWKNGKIAPMLWDIDGVYGTDWWGGTCNAPGVGMWNSYATSAWPLSFMWTLYKNEIKATYTELRNHGIIDMNTWKSIVFGWANQIGTEAFDRDIKRWPEMPSYRDNYTNIEYWQEYGSSSAYSTYPTWNENTSYSIGDIVVIKIHPSVNWYLRYKAVKASDAQNPQPPVTKLYGACPQVGGYYDSPRRMEKWMEEQIRLCDTVMEYNQ